MVLRVIEQRHAEYQKCYTEALSWSPGLKGRLVIGFTVESDGQVSAAAEQSAPGEKFSDELVTGCVAEQLRTLSFPPGPEAFRVVYPIIFRQKPAKAR